MERIRNRGLEVLLGLIFVVAMLATIVVIWQSFRGKFGDTYHVDAHLTQAGDALEIGDVVSYRNVVVGEVASASGNLDGSAVARLNLRANQAKVIPDNVGAIAVPASLFGATAIELIPSDTPTSQRLHDGSVIQPSTTKSAESLQTALANAYTLLTSIHPAELDAALTALASALDGQGDNIGKLIVQADDYLRALAPHMGDLDNVITSLATVSDELAKNTPDFLQSLRNLLVVSGGIQRQKQAVANLLAIAPTAIDNAQLLLSPANVNHAVTIFRDYDPLSAALSERPKALVDTIAGFRAFATAFGSATADGPWLNAAVYLTGPNLAELMPLVAGKPSNALSRISDPPLYTSADCPRYAGLDGPNCGATAGTAGTSARVITTGLDYGGTSASVGSRTEIFAVRNAAAAMTKLPESQIPDVVDLLLGPLLRGIPTVIR